jgi:catechol 2,3-dioxygenase-like lactoylglutathione lyase family enzyme
MKIILTGIFVSDQDKALKFYSDTLGFVKKTDVSAGQYRWLTVVSPDDLNGVELVLEPNNNPAAKTYQQQQKHTRMQYSNKISLQKCLLFLIFAQSTND